MTTPKTTVIRRPHRVRCVICGDTGIVRTYEPAYLGKTTNGEPVFNPRRLVLMQHFCGCKKGSAA